MPTKVPKYLYLPKITHYMVLYEYMDVVEQLRIILLYKNSVKSVPEGITSLNNQNLQFCSNVLVRVVYRNMAKYKG